MKEARLVILEDTPLVLLNEQKVTLNTGEGFRLCTSYLDKDEDGETVLLHVLHEDFTNPFVITGVNARVVVREVDAGDEVYINAPTGTGPVAVKVIEPRGMSPRLQNLFAYEYEGVEYEMECADIVGIRA